MFKKEIIKKIVNAIGIEKGDLVLIQFWGEEEDRETLHNFSYEVTSLGASPFEFQQSRKVNAKLFENIKEGSFNEKFYSIFENVDIVIDVFMQRPVVPGENFPMENFDAYRKYMGNFFKALQGKRKFVQLRIPTEANALDSSIDKDLFIQRMNLAYDIDYVELKRECEEKLSEIKGKNKVTIKTGENNILNLSLENREWFIDAGDGDLPCGEIYIAPLEKETNGSVFFKEIFLEGEDGPLHDTNVRIEVKNGQIVDSDSEMVKNYLSKLPPNGNVICELGLGFNKNVTSLVGYTVLDEKMNKTFHLGIGRNLEFGGKNESVMHTDLVTFGEVIFE